MKINKIHLVYFSPTHTSKQVGEAIVHGIDVNCLETISLNDEQKAENLVFPSDELVCIAAPVYAGHVAPLALKRLEMIKGTGTPAVLVLIYGNRAYEKALFELNSFVEMRGFKVIAGATFIGEHSYSNSENPIAPGRPNADDLVFATEFGQKIKAKILAAETLDTLYSVDVRNIQRPKQPFFPLFRFLRKLTKLRKDGVVFPATPSVKDEEACVHCGICVDVCPSGAILRGNELVTDPSKCIRCCACVKSCKSHVRIYDTPLAPLLSQCFMKQKQPQIII